MNRKNNKLIVIDLFSGCGGLSHGFALAGFDIVLGIDNWELGLDTFKRNHPNSKILVADLEKIKPEEIVKKNNLRGVDLIIGGPPCQGFSISGKRTVDDPRNKLYKSFVDFADKKLN